MNPKLRKVIEAPDAIEPRLAYAESLGVDPRAEFIRLQIRAAALRASPTWPPTEYREARKRADALLSAHGTAWTEGVDKIAPQVRFYRGFVEAITIDADGFLANANTLYGLAPIRHVTLKDARPSIAAIAGSSHLARLRSLGLQMNKLSDDDLRVLVDSPHLGALSSLDLSFNQITRSGVEALAASPNLSALRYVNLEGNPAPNPVEDFGTDAITGLINRAGIQLPAFGAELEAKFGRRRWLHAPSELPSFPPGEIDF